MKSEPENVHTELHDPKLSRISDREPAWCPECRRCLYGGYGHRPDCSKHSTGDLEYALDRLKKDIAWHSKKTASMWEQLQRMTGKLAILRHENNKLRAANEKLRIGDQ